MQNTMTNEELQDAITEANEALVECQPDTPEWNIWRIHLNALLEVQTIRAVTVHEDGIDSAGPEPAQDGQADKIGRLTQTLALIRDYGGQTRDGVECSDRWCARVARETLEAEKEAHHDGT